MREIFAPSGPLAQSLSQYEIRESQQIMAEAVADLLAGQLKTVNRHIAPGCWW